MGREYGLPGSHPAPVPSCQVPYHFLVADVPMEQTACWAPGSSLLSLIMEEEAMSSGGRRGQSFGNSHHISLRERSYLRLNRVFLWVFLDPDKVHPMDVSTSLPLSGLEGRGWPSQPQGHFHRK